MNFNQHLNLKGKHAFLSPSKYHWINYDENKVRDAYRGYLAVERGTRLHALAAELIALRQNLPRSSKTLNMFVNDAIAYNMTPEQPLYYSDNCFGTADVISFYRNKLRIHDYKSGKEPAHMEQLYVYAALFCLEYNVKPGAIDIELRIYQNDEISVVVPAPETIIGVMDIIIRDSKIVDEIKNKEA